VNEHVMLHVVPCRGNRSCIENAQDLGVFCMWGFSIICSDRSDVY